MTKQKQIQELQARAAYKRALAKRLSKNYPLFAKFYLAEARQDARRAKEIERQAKRKEVITHGRTSD